jgi:Protein of unknown function (DUF669)
MSIKVNTVSDQEARSGDGTGYLPSGTYHCVITNVEAAESQSEKNPGKPLLKFTSVVQDGEYADREIKWTACCWSGALYTIINLLKALDMYEDANKASGLDIPDAEEAYVTKHVMVRRGLNKNAKKENPEDDPMTWIEVRGFAPYKEGLKSGTPAPGASKAKASVLP